MHESFEIPIDSKFLDELTHDWGPVAYIYHYPELNLIRIGDSRSVSDRIRTHYNSLPGPIRLLRVARGGKPTAREWEKYLDGSFKSDSGGSWYTLSKDTEAFLRKIKQEGEQMIVEKLIEIERDRHALAMERLGATVEQ